MGIVQEYLEEQQKYEANYGERTVVLMAIGSFYEIWEYDPSNCADKSGQTDSTGKVWSERIGHAVELSTILQCALRYENKDEPYSINSPHKIGFPVIAFDKFSTTLLANDFTVVRIDQKKVPVPGKKNPKIERYLSGILSPTTQIDAVKQSQTTSNILCIYIEYQSGNRTYDNFLITVGVSVLDIVTGCNRVCEFYSKTSDPVSAIQELYRFLVSHQPRELVIHVSDVPDGIDYIKYLDKTLDLKRFRRVSTHVNEVPPEYKHLPYQIEFLNKLFPASTSAVQVRDDRIINRLGLDQMNYGRIAYMILLRHCHSYNLEIISNLFPPDLEWIDGQTHLILTHNAIDQLDLMMKSFHRRTRRSEIDSLMSILDKNRTHLGRRALYNLLQNPMSQPDKIEQSYQMVHEMLTLEVEHRPLWMVADQRLKELPDIARLHRKLIIGSISPKEVAILYRAYLKIIQLYVILMQVEAPVLHQHMLSPEVVNNFNQFIARYTSIFDFEALECCSLDSSTELKAKWMNFVTYPFQLGVYPHLDTQINQLQAAEDRLIQIVDHLNTFLTGTRGRLLETRSAKKKPGATKQMPTGVVLATTNAKSKVLERAAVDMDLCGQIQTSHYTSSEKIITSDIIAQLCKTIDTIRRHLRIELFQLYQSMVDEMSNYMFLEPLATFVGQIDLLQSYAKISYRNHYHRPEIDTDSPNSYLEAEQIRHPIIEQLIDGAYVTNDIFLGHGTEESSRSNGMLLYGLNMAGKSSLAKALALNIIMAQIGCYTPSKLKYAPYRKIITRLSGCDNILSGDSSFSIEMRELGTILRQADHRTLVVGDELCRGTENISGTGIITSAILSLIRQQPSFIFATHVHDVATLPQIQQIPDEHLRICHLTVTKDPETNQLIYDRKLQPGSGPHIYGIMVAESLGLPDDFIRTAYNISNFLIGKGNNVLSPNPSKYNPKIHVNECSLCGKTKYQTQLHTHHIIEQRQADEKGMIHVDQQFLHKNQRDNLIVLCQQCHQDLHQQGKELETVTIPNGTMVRYKQ